VSAALLPSLRDASSSAARRFHLDAPSWYHEPETPELLPVIADAVWDDRLLRARYRRGGGREQEGTEVARELAPYGLVLKAGVWYLCARAGEDFRVYRIDRFTAVEPAEARFDRDETFDLPGFWEERAAGFARSLLRTEVTVRVSGRGARMLAYTGDRAAAAGALAKAPEPGPDGLRTLTLPVESLDVAYGQLLALGPELEVLAPESLRIRFADAAERLREMYR
ncbi:WYL domain-containing protein, partial [Streptomyces sp. SID7499]|nr:WYL domain-containing protein [Streptomyces sp. SID7499]